MNWTWLQSRLPRTGRLGYLTRGLWLVSDEIAYRLPSGHALPPWSAQIELTYHCNSVCQVCPLTCQPRASPGQVELSTDEVKAIIDQLSASSPVLHLALTGGEVLLRRDTLEILEYATTRHIPCTLLTNGILLTQEVAERLVDLRLRHLLISIDGAEEIHDRIRGVKGAFAKTVAGLERVKEYKNRAGVKHPRVWVDAVIQRSNLAHLGQIVDISADVGADFCLLQVLDPGFLSGSRIGLHTRDTLEQCLEVAEAGAEEPVDGSELKALLEKAQARARERGVQVDFLPHCELADVLGFCNGRVDLKRWTCRKPWKGITVSAYGDVYPCLNYRIGNIREQKIAQLWNNERYRFFRKAVRGEGLFPACIGCCDMLRKTWRRR